MNLQSFVDGMNEQWRQERSASQMTLSAMIDHLSRLPNDEPIQGIAKPHSYRGYYSDLAFEPDEGETTAGEALDMCQEALGAEMTGYKGGEFLMSEDTPVWLAFYGSCGQKIIAIREDGTFELEDDD